MILILNLKLIKLPVLDNIGDFFLSTSPNINIVMISKLVFATSIGPDWTGC